MGFLSYNKCSRFSAMPDLFCIHPHTFKICDYKKSFLDMHVQMLPFLSISYLVSLVPLIWYSLIFHFAQLAEKELQKMNAFKAPREKLQCIMNCCRIINNLLLNASFSENHTLRGADDFLPVLIYVTIKASSHW